MIEKLRGLEMFRSFSEETLAALARRLTSRRYEKGETVFEEGDEGETLYVVDTGEIAIRKEGKTLAVLRDGQMFGEMALFEREKRSAAAVATRETSAYAISNDDFRAFLLEHSEAGARFLFESVQELSRRLRRTSEYLTTVFETGRIVGEGLGPREMAERILRRLLDDVGEASGGTIALYNAIVESYEITCQLAEATLDIDSLARLVSRHTGEDVFQEAEGATVLGVTLKDDTGKVLGYIILEKEGGSPFSAQQEIVVAAVGQQTGLGILHAYDRQEEEARRRLERGRTQWGGG